MGGNDSYDGELDRNSGNGPARKWLAYSALALVGLIAFCALALLFFWWKSQPPAVWENTPIYPNAQSLSVEDFGPKGKFVSEPEFRFLRKSIAFTVADTDTNVRAFYKDALTRGGMDYLGYDSQAGPIRDLGFMWTTPGRSSSMYNVDITTSPTGTNQTEVKIEISYFPGY